VRVLSSWYDSLPLPSSGSSAFFVKGNIVNLRLEPLSLCSRHNPLFSHAVNQFPHSLLLPDQNPSPPWPDSGLVVQIPDHFLVLPDITELVEAVCHRKETPSTRVPGVKYCGKPFSLSRLLAAKGIEGSNQEPRSIWFLGKIFLSQWHCGYGKSGSGW
jgi:hypothetical protein